MIDRVKELKRQLLDIRDNEWVVPNHIDKYKFTLECMDNLGNLDSELRDDLILNFIWNMIYHKQISKEQIKNLLNISLSDKHLFFKLGKQEDDSVFNRSFSVLVIRWIIYYHNNYGEDLLSEMEMLKVFTNTIRYIRLEKDTRGYIEGKGWAHSTAHSGDALFTFALCNFIKHDQLLQILQVIKEKASISYYVYKNLEMERLVIAVVNVINRNILSEEELTKWIRSFEDVKNETTYPESQYLRENVKDLLRSLYFRLKFKKQSKVLIDEIEIVLNKINDNFNNFDAK